ncbi:glycosyltransferase [Scytonema sp. NUACC26]|uniref:glycosyltransferase n=1 Tax=Scytonema sp. NUACC26 TaxID=3140176 RepID=UPI0034DC3DFE
MKIIQTLARYFPDKCGGIQVNLSELIPQLQLQGLEIKIAAAKVGTHQEDSYKYEGIEVYRYPVFPKPKSQPNHGQFPHKGFEYFARWLTSQNADIYHQHHWEVLCGLPHLQLAKKLGMATLVTIHYPLPICQRITLMLNGQEACDGKIDVARCSYCCDSLSKNLPQPMVRILSQMPMPVISRLTLPESAYIPASFDNKSLGSIIRPFVVPGYVAARQNSLQEMARYADRIVVVCDWLYQALLINGIPKDKLILCRYGISYFTVEKFYNNRDISSKDNVKTKPLRVAFLGRWDDSKGIDILVKAVKNLPTHIKIELVIHGIVQDEKYRKTILNLIAEDSRICIDRQLSREELPTVLTNYDLLAVPSQWLETGPLVVLEAHACGVPVIGSNLGGIAELVKHGVDGWLVRANDVQAWTEALLQLSTNQDLLNKLREGIKPVRSVKMQAQQVAEIYSNLISSRISTSSLG